MTRRTGKSRSACFSMPDDPTSLTASVRPHQRNITPRAVVLVGFMGAGKTSVGKLLAQQLGWAFEDLDDRIQRREQRSVEEIFQKSGEAEFRRAEREALRELLSELETSPRIIALGGGAFVQVENAAALEEAKVLTIFLDAPVEELFRRCAQDSTSRPLRRNAEQFSKLYENRKSCYMKALRRIETSGKDITSIAAEIASALADQALVNQDERGRD